MMQPFKQYFASQPNTPVILQKFFDDPNGELWLYFLHNVAVMFNETVQKMEGDKILATEVANHYFNLRKNLLDRKETSFLPMKVKEIQKKNFSAGQGSDLQDIKNTVSSFYDHCITYLDLWKSNVDSLSQLSWIDLKNILKWEELEESWIIFESVLPPISHDDLFNEVSVLNTQLSENVLGEWRTQEKTTEQRWLTVFENLRKIEINVPNLKMFVKFVLCLPGSNASVERAFS